MVSLETRFPLQQIQDDPHLARYRYPAGGEAADPAGDRDRTSVIAEFGQAPDKRCLGETQAFKRGAEEGGAFGVGGLPGAGGAPSRRSRRCRCSPLLRGWWRAWQSH